MALNSISLLGGRTPSLPAGAASAIGTTAGIAATQVAYGSAANTIKGSDQMVFVEGDSLKLSATVANGVQVHNTADMTTNVQRLDALFSSNAAQIGSRTVGTIAATPVNVFSQGINAAAFYAKLVLDGSASNPRVRVGVYTTASGTTAASTSIAGGSFMAMGELISTATSGTGAVISILPTYNQSSGTAANTDLLINRTQTAIGSGAQLLIDAQVGSASQFSVSNAGIINACASTATPAGGATTARLVFGTTAGFGIYYGSGVPSVSAGQGSIYLRSDGSSTITRLYVNTNGTTGWTNFVSTA